MHKLLLILVSFFSSPLFANPVVNVYVWGGEIPNQIIQKFEEETGIKVNFSTYDSNETMYAKLRASQGVYDVILPSSYFVERMKKIGMLTALDHNKLPEINNLRPEFSNNDYDEHNQYSVPITWGATGIFYNTDYFSKPIYAWKDLWKSNFKRKLLLLDDSRELFGTSLLSLGYHPNDSNPNHIKEAYEKLLALVPNVKLFSTEGIQALLIDEDATAGIVWNGDAFKAQNENSHLKFVYPQEGFVIWVDCLAIPSHAKHIEEAYRFINFILRPEISALIGKTQGHAITNAAGIALLPEEIKKNETIYPSPNVLSHGFIQRDPGEGTIGLFNQYWQKLKLAF